LWHVLPKVWMQLHQSNKIPPIGCPCYKLRLKKVTNKCFHQVPKGLPKFPMYFPTCSQYNHTFIPYALPKVVLFSST
jgi:hypothetical protein